MSVTPRWPGSVRAAIRSAYSVEATGWGCVKAFLRSGLAEQHVTLAAPTRADCATYEIERTPSAVRLVRDVTPNGRVRVLMTNPLDAQAFPAAQFGPLYHQRRRIEKLSSGSSTGWRSRSGFGAHLSRPAAGLAAKVLADNLCAALALADQPEAALTRPNRS